jgi:hypothetical protein
MTKDELAELERISDAAYREGSMAGLEAHYDKLRAGMPLVLAELKSIRKMLGDACRFGSEMIDCIEEQEDPDEIAEYRDIIADWRERGGIEP